VQQNGRWRIVESEIVIDTPHLRLRRDRVALPNGLEFEPYYVRESRGFAIVFAITVDERVVLVRQYKHGIGSYVLESRRRHRIRRVPGRLRAARTQRRDRLRRRSSAT